MDTLGAWSWTFLVLYIGLMIHLGRRGQRQVASADDFAVARGAYGPLTLAVAYAATAASGATFLGLPGLAYQYGMGVLWVGLLYPVGIYIGVMLCQRMVARFGNRLGHRSIPELLGDRYQSEAIRIVASLFSLLLMFYIAGQLIGGLVMFEVLLGLDRTWALLLTTGVLGVYVVLGGTHADIMTDGVQGAIMLGIAVMVGAMFATGYGADGFAEMLARLETLDSRTLMAFNPDFGLANSAWDLVAMMLAFIPLGLLPHLANKLWALDSPDQQNRFVIYAISCGVAFQLLVFGGLLARAVLGDSLLHGPTTPNAALPLLFVEVFSPWLAGLLGAAILAAVMSTVDGLVISSSQVFANDLYRRSLAHRWHGSRTEDEIERTTLRISRWGTGLTLLAATGLAWMLFDRNIILVTWIGIGGLVAALAGSLVLGIFWKGVTRTGALSGFVVGASVFIVLHAAALPDASGLGQATDAALAWLRSQAANPYACAALGELAAVATTVLVSLGSKALPASHLREVFDE